MKHVHKAVPRCNTSRLIPHDKFRRMYKRRMRFRNWFRRLFVSDEAMDSPLASLAIWLGSAALYAGGMWLLVMAIVEMAVGLVV